MLDEFGYRLVGQLAPDLQQEYRQVAVSAPVDGGGVDDQHALLALDWLLRVWTPTWLDFGAEGSTSTRALEAVGPLRSRRDVPAIVSRVKAVLERQNTENTQHRVDEYVSRPVVDSPDDEATRDAAHTALHDVLRFLFPSRTVAVITLDGSRPRSPRADEVWSTLGDAAWESLPTDLQEGVPWFGILQTVEETARWTLLYRARGLARTAAEAWNDTWLSGKDERAAGEAAYAAVRPRPRRSDVWFEQAAVRVPRRTGGWSEARRRRRIPSASRAAAVTEAVLVVLRSDLEPIITSLQTSALRCFRDMVDLFPAATPPSPQPSSAAPSPANPVMDAATAAAAVGLSTAPQLEAQGDLDGARRVYLTAIETGHSQLAPGAMLSLAMMLENRAGDTAQAEHWYTKAAETGDPDAAPMAMQRLGGLLAEQGDAQGARTWLTSVLGSGHPEASAWAMLDLASLSIAQDDTGEARRWYEKATEADHSGVRAWAALHLARLTEDLGEHTAGRRWYVRAIDSADDDVVGPAAEGLGAMLEEHGDLTGAEARYRQAADSGHERAAPRAMRNLAVLLDGRGDLAGAREWYRKAIDTGSADIGPLAMCMLGLLLERTGERGARELFQRAIDSRDDLAAPLAMVGLAGLSERDGHRQSARRLYQRALESGSGMAAEAAQAGLARLA